jgi:hypothetical protein
MTHPPTVTRADREAALIFIKGPAALRFEEWRRVVELDDWTGVADDPHDVRCVQSAALAFATHREATEAAIVALVAEIGGPSLIDYLKRGLLAPDASGEPTGFWSLDRKASRVLQALIERGEHRR